MNQNADSIAGFLTDGVLARLCESIGSMSGAVVSLHEPGGSLILPSDGDPPWKIVEIDPSTGDELVALMQSGGNLDGIERGCEGIYVEPIRAAGRVIGAFSVRPTGGTSDATVGGLAQMVRLLSATVGEFCSQAESLHDRNDELDMLFRLSGMLVEAKDVDTVLDVALRFAIRLCNGDAGVVHLLEEKNTVLVLRAKTGLSDRFTERLSRLPVEQISDRDALGGSVRCVSDLLIEGRAMHLEEIEREGLVGMVSSGLVFNGTPLGIVRVYSRSHTEIDPSARGTLQTILEQAAAAVASQRLRQTEREHRRVQRQLELASEVQHRMLPEQIPEISGVDVGVRYESSFELGGDFYDVMDLGGHLGVLIGDVVGKGVAAALLMASVRATIRAHAHDQYHLNEVMRLANIALVRDTRVNEFATVFYGVVDPESRRLTFCSAGHEPPLSAVIDRSAGTVRIERIEGSGLVLGVDETQSYTRLVRHLSPGELVLTYTDGVIDAMNFSGERFGRDRLEDAVRGALLADQAIDAQGVVDHVFWEVRRFVGMNPRTDDITIVGVRMN